MKKINLRESLLELDKQTGFKYTLTDLYEACMLGEDDKKKLVQYVADRDIKGMSNMLSNAAGVMTENVADDLTDDEVLESLPGMGLPNLPNPLSEECDDATLSLQAASKLEDIEYIMSYEMADFVVYDGDRCGEYRVGYDSGYTLDIRFDLNTPGYVYYINGKGPYETMSDETIKSDIKRELDSVLWGYYVNNKKKTLGESLEKGDEITLWWKDPSWDKTAPCYARVEFTGMTKDGKYKFMSLTYGHTFVVDVARNEITTPEGKTFNLDNSSGWMRVFNKSVNETFNPGDLVYVKPSKKTGRVKSVKGDNVEVEVNGGNDPDRIDTFYNTDLELQDNVEEGWNPNMTDCPTCGDTSFDSKKGRCGKCGYRESLQEYWPYDDDEEDSEYEYIARKYVQDSDGFQTEYTWYKSPDGLNVFVFGDSELYTPEDGNFDHEEENDDAAQEWFDSYVGFGDDLVDLVDFDEGMTKDALVESEASDDGKVFYEFRDARGYTVHELDDIEVTDDAQAIMAGKSNPKVVTVTKFINGSRKPDEVLWERESDRWYLSRYVGGAEYEYAEGGYYYETLTLDGSLEFATKEEAMEELKNQVKEYDEGELVFMNDTEARFKFGKYIGDVEELHVERERGLHSSGKKVYEELEVTDDPKSWPNDKVLTYEDALALAKAYYSQGGDGFYETADKGYFDYLTKEYGPQTVKQMKQSFGVFDSVAKDRMCEAIKYPNGQPVTDIDLDKALDYQYGTDRDKNNSTYSDEEKQRAVNYWIEKTDGMWESLEDDPTDCIKYSKPIAPELRTPQMQLTSHKIHKYLRPRIQKTYATTRSYHTKSIDGHWGNYFDVMTLLSDEDIQVILDWAKGIGINIEFVKSTPSDNPKRRSTTTFKLLPDHSRYRWSLEEAAAPDYSPKQTGKAYKVFRVKNGKLYPPMVANPGGADTPVGVWLTAEEGEFAGVSKTGRPQVKSIGSGTLSYRPGWHLGDIPRASQFDRTNKETGEKEFPKDFVWAVCDYVMDVDYQPESDEQGYMRMGKDGKPYRSDKYQHSLAGLPKLPKDGYYKYRTNPRPDTVPWVITGAIRVNKLLSDAEVNSILQSKGIEPIHRQGGDKTLAELGL